MSPDVSTGAPKLGLLSDENNAVPKIVCKKKPISNDRKLEWFPRGQGKYQNHVLGNYLFNSLSGKEVKAFPVPDIKKHTQIQPGRIQGELEHSLKIKDSSWRSRKLSEQIIQVALFDRIIILPLFVYSPRMDCKI